MSAEDVINFFSLSSEITAFFSSWNLSISFSSSNKIGEGSVEISVTISDMSKDWFYIKPIIFPFKREISSAKKLMNTMGTFSVLCMSMLCIIGTTYKFGYSSVRK